jgi:endonuclease III
MKAKGGKRPVAAPKVPARAAVAGRRAAAAKPARRAAGESAAARADRAARILARLDEAYPGAGIELDFRTPLELLVATILSAQCTDERVNQVTADLFRRYTTAKDYALADPAALERDIHSTGFFRAKARALIGMGRALVERHGGVVPGAADALVALPGVGRKTASVVLGNAFGVPAIAVDTHVFRVSQRLGLAHSDDADEIQDQLGLLLPETQWTRATHLLIVHGRRTCFARKPDCPRCAVRTLCPWPDKTAGAAPETKSGK